MKVNVFVTIVALISAMALSACSSATGANLAGAAGAAQAESGSSTVYVSTWPLDGPATTISRDSNTKVGSITLPAGNYVVSVRILAQGGGDCWIAPRAETASDTYFNNSYSNYGLTETIQTTVSLSQEQPLNIECRALANSTTVKLLSATSIKVDTIVK